MRVETNSSMTVPVVLKELISKEAVIAMVDANLQRENLLLSEKVIVLLLTDKTNKEYFIRAIRKFMHMDSLTAPLLIELIEKIDVCEVKGTGKNRTQQLEIHYKFVGCIDIPEVPSHSNYTQEIRKGVSVEYLPKPLSA